MSSTPGAVTVASVVLLGVLVVTHVPYWRRYRQVRRRSTPTWLEWALAAWGSDSLLSRQASTLEQAGYIAIRKGHVGKWPRTWLKLTPEGRNAFNDHLNTLREIVETPTGDST